MGKLYVFVRLWSYIAKYKSRLLLIGSLGLLGIGFEVAKPLPVKLVIDNVLSNHPLPAFILDIFRNTHT